MTHSANAFETLMMPYLDSLYQIAFRMVHDQATAERCTERTYVQAAKSFHHLAPVQDAKCWLFSILFRVITEERTGWRGLKHWLTGTTAAERDELLRALDALPANHRAAVLLQDVEGFRTDEIARILRLPAGLAEARLAEGRALLHAALSAGPNGGGEVLEGTALA